MSRPHAVVCPVQLMCKRGLGHSRVAARLKSLGGFHFPKGSVDEVRARASLESHKTLEDQPNLFYLTDGAAQQMLLSYYKL